MAIFLETRVPQAVLIPSVQAQSCQNSFLKQNYGFFKSNTSRYRSWSASPFFQIIYTTVGSVCWFGKDGSGQVTAPSSTLIVKTILSLAVCCPFQTKVDGIPENSCF